MNGGLLASWLSGLAAGSVKLATPLDAARWAVLACVPLAIIALYFLKLRRRPVQVPSTLLWRRSLEDLHVNSLFQRLRRNLLLFLQLLAVGLAMLALTGLRSQGSAGPVQHYILVIDQSASMSATDVAPSRLEAAKREARKILDAMRSTDRAMIIAFASRARVVSSYTSNRALLRQRLAAIEPTQQGTSLREALELAAGLANPASDIFARNLPQGVIATDAMVPPRLMIYTDGGFPDIEGFSVGNLVPEVVVVGPTPQAVPVVKGSTATNPPGPPSDNVAILALQTARNEDKPDQFQLFGRVRNYRAEAVQTEAKLLRHDPARPDSPGTLIDAVGLSLEPQSEHSFKFDLPDSGQTAALEVQLAVTDAQPLDNHAFTVMGVPRKAQVLLVTAGDHYLTETMKTPALVEVAAVEVVSPDEARGDAHRRAIQEGRYDLVIYDQVRPESDPEANTLYLGALPPGKAFDDPRPVESPVILDWNIAHPLLQYVRDLSLVRVAKARVVPLRQGATSLIESSQGPLAFIAPRGAYLDAVLTFGLFDGKTLNTDWPVHVSFPLFIFNAVRMLGNAREATGGEAHAPGQTVTLRADMLAERIDVRAPDGHRSTLTRSPRGTFLFNQTDRTGLYEAEWKPDGTSAFAVNLFDPRESDLAPRGLAPAGTPADRADAYTIKIGHTAVSGTAKSVPSEISWWPWFTLAMLGIVLFEWYLYNRRVYI